MMGNYAKCLLSLDCLRFRLRLPWFQSLLRDKSYKFGWSHFVKEKYGCEGTITVRVSQNERECLRDLRVCIQLYS